MRIAHCSDLHLLSHDGAKWRELANKRWIGAANLMTNRSRHYHVAAFDDMIDDLNATGIDHVLCTGDVTNIALPQEFVFARARFAKLAKAPHDVTVIPGNHDAYVSAGVPLFAEHFGDLSSSDPEWQSDHRFPLVRVRGDLAIIGLSTSRQTPWFTAYGKLEDAQLQRLDAILGDARLATKARLVAIHHPPAGRRAKNKIRGLRDHAAFAEVIKARGCELIVHGHEHRDMTETLDGPDGPITVRGVASGTYLHNKPDKVARYRIFEISGRRITEVGVRVWDPTGHRFGPPEPAQLAETSALTGNA